MYIYILWVIFPSQNNSGVRRYVFMRFIVNKIHEMSFFDRIFDGILSKRKLKEPTRKFFDIPTYRIVNGLYYNDK